MCWRRRTRKERGRRFSGGARPWATPSSRTSRWWSSRPTRSPSKLPSPASGTLIEVLKAENAEVQPGRGAGALAVARRIDSGRDVASRPSASEASEASGASRAGGGSTAPATSRADSELLSPSVRRLLHEHGIAAGDINGTGRNGRITAQDVARHVSASARVRSARRNASLRARRSIRPQPARSFRTPPSAAGWPSTWRAASTKPRTSRLCSKRT